MKNSMFLTRQTRKRDIHLHAKYTTWLMFWGLYNTQKESPRRISDSQKWRLPTLPQHAVPSALLSLTTLFGMGRGGTSAL